MPNLLRFSWTLNMSYYKCSGRFCLHLYNMYGNYNTVMFLFIEAVEADFQVALFGSYIGPCMMSFC